MNDLIRKSALVDALTEQAKNMAEVAANSAGQAVDYYSGMKTGFASAAIMANSAPTIEPKKGKWETKPFSDPNDPMKDTGAVWCRCSECKTKLGVFKDGNFFNYCPNCGAKMDGDIKDSE